jgi:hypothetical protein
MQYEICCRRAAYRRHKAAGERSSIASACRDMVGRVALHTSVGDSQNRGKEQPGQERCFGHDARMVSKTAVWL